MTQPIWEIEAEGSRTQSLPEVHSDSKATLGNLGRPCLKIKGSGKETWELESSVE